VTSGTSLRIGSGPLLDLEALDHPEWLSIDTMLQGGLTLRAPSANHDVPHEVRLVLGPL
jgi:hypothetical protein